MGEDGVQNCAENSGVCLLPCEYQVISSSVWFKPFEDWLLMWVKDLGESADFVVTLNFITGMRNSIRGENTPKSATARIKLF